MSDIVNPRRYDSSRRRAAAADRRHEIVRTAAELFLADGYAQTTMAEIARQSAVSNDLVFRLFGNKRGVLKEVMDYVIGGDDQDLPMLERDGPQAVRHSSDQREQVRLFSAGITEQLRRVGPYQALLQTAAAVEPEIAALRDDLNTRQRHQSMTAVAQWLSGNGPLKDAMTVDHAAAILWTLTSSEVYAMLTRDRRWTDDEYRRWLADTLDTTMLPRDPTSAAQS